MKLQYWKSFPPLWCRYCKLILAFCWCSGLCAGQVLLLSAGTPAWAVLGRQGSTGLSAVLFSLWFPLLISAGLLLLGKYSRVCVFCLLEAVLFSYITLGMSICGGPAASFFPWGLGMSVQYWLWQHFLSGRNRPSAAVLIFLLSLDFLMACFLFSSLFADVF